MNFLYQHLQYRAENNPNDWAIITSDTKLNFKQVFLLVNQVAQKINAHGVQPGQLIITHLGNKHVDWIVTLACFALSCRTCSTHSLETLSEFEHDWVIGNSDMKLIDQRKIIEIKTSWFTIDKSETQSTPSKSNNAHEIQRIILTSGTTGTSKALLISHTDLHQRIMCAIYLRGPHPHSLNLMGLSTLSGFLNACANLLLGYPLFVVEKNHINFISNKLITLINCTPLQLENLAPEILSKKTPIQQIRVTGGLIPQPVANLFLKQPSDISLVTDYGSSEVGLVCTKIINSKQGVRVVGKPYIGVSYEIVNDSDEPMPDLEVGRIRIKKEHMPLKYLNDNINQAFHDGWFYPGDLGFITKTGELAILGRFEDVVNIGGVKLNLNMLDEKIKEKVPTIKDAAFFTYTEQDSTRLGVAICLNNQANWDETQKNVTNLFNKVCPISTMMRIPNIPRNQMSKIPRKNLEKIYLNISKK